MGSTEQFFIGLSLQNMTRQIGEAETKLAAVNTEIQKAEETRDMRVQQIAIADGELKKISNQHAKETAEMVALRAERESMKCDVEAVIEGINQMQEALRS
jgi:hypothetical protein